MKKELMILFCLVLVFLGGIGLPAQQVRATEGQTTEAIVEETETEKETEPAALSIPIESNNVEKWPKGPRVIAESAVVMDAASGALLYSKDCDTRKYPASITKIMTTLVALENGKMDDVITFSDNAIYSIEPDSTHLGIQPGEQLTLEQSLYGVLLASANEISNGVAEHVGGSIENFVQMMNDKAKELGCTNTNFVNPHGLHDDNHYTTAKDIALITQAALKNKTFCKIAGTLEYSYEKTNLVDEPRYFMNHQRMLYEEGSQYEGCLGGKTGFTDQAWNTLVTFAEREKMKLISVVMKTNGFYVTINESTQLLDYAFANFERQKLGNGEATETFASVMQIPCLGIRTILVPGHLMDRIWKVSKASYVTMPKDMDGGQAKRTWDSSINRLTYQYHDWEVGRTAMKLRAFLPELNKGVPYRGMTDFIKTQDDIADTVETTGETESIKGKVTTMWGKIKDVLVSTHEKVDLFIKENTIESAVIGGILLLIFLPLLITAVIRNRRYKRIMRERKAEDLLLKEREAQIERKTPEEIVEEIRREEEERRTANAKAEARRVAAERATQELEAIERVLREDTTKEK